MDSGSGQRFIVLFLLTFPSCVQSEMCYHCTSEFVIMYWGRFLPVQADDEVITDASCLKTTETSKVIHCDGPCLSVNVTTTGEGNSTRTVGMMRDCQKKYYRGDRYSDQKHRSCRNQIVQIRHHTVNAQYCFCLGNYCNGDQMAGPEIDFQKRPKYRTVRGHQRNRSSNSKFPFLCNIQLLIFICALSLCRFVTVGYYGFP